MKKLLSASFKGFTLIELLIVITIIGIFAVALLPSIVGAPGRARDAQRKADLNNIIAALETYNADKQAYPATSSCVSAITGFASYFQGAKIPNDPQSPKSSGAACPTGYAYCKLNAPQNYGLVAAVEIAGDSNHNAAVDCSSFPTTLTKSTDDTKAYYVITK